MAAWMPLLKKFTRSEPVLSPYMNSSSKQVSAMENCLLELADEAVNGIQLASIFNCWRLNIRRPDLWSINQHLDMQIGRNRERTALSVAALLGSGCLMQPCYWRETPAVHADKMPLILGIQLEQSLTGAVLAGAGGEASQHPRPDLGHARRLQHAGGGARPEAERWGKAESSFGTSFPQESRHPALRRGHLSIGQPY